MFRKYKPCALQQLSASIDFLCSGVRIALKSQQIEYVQVDVDELVRMVNLGK